MNPAWYIHWKRLSKKKMPTESPASTTAIFQGSRVPASPAIHPGGRPRSESITQPTSSGGIRSRILLATLAEVARPSRPR